MRAIEDIDWAALTDAYGPAVEVPHRVRALASPDADVARRALNDLDAGILHQGSFYPATALAVPYIVDAVARATPSVKAEIALFLANVAAVHGAQPMAFEPWVFRSMPAPPDYAEAVAAVEAVRSARDAFVPWLDDDEPTLRAVAAFLLSGIDPTCVGALGARLDVEADPLVRATLLLALAGLGQRADGSARSDLEHECLAATRVLAGSALDGDLARLEALAIRPWEESVRFPFRGGDLCALACTALLALGRSRRDDVFAAARRALDVRIARGESVPPPPEPPSSRLSDPYPSPPSPLWDPRPGAALGALARVLATLAFGDRLGNPALIRRETLDADQRAVLSLTAEHGIPIPVRGAPWLTAAAMRRFLSGGGPLDRELTLDGVTAPIIHHLYPGGDDFDADGARIDRVAEALPPEERLDVIEDVFAGSYAGDGGTVLHGQLLERLVRSLDAHLDALAPRLEAYAARCAGRAGEVYSEEARLALAVFERDRAVPPEAWDPLVASALVADPERGHEWLSAFPASRQARIATWSGDTWVLDQLDPTCPTREVERAIMERFLDPACPWQSYDAAPILGLVEDLPALLDARDRTEGRRRAVLDSVIRERTGEGQYTLRLTRGGDAIDAALLDGGGRGLVTVKIPLAPRVPDFELVAAAIDDRARAVISMEGDLDRTTRYTIQRHLGDLGIGEVRDGGTTLRRG